MPDSGTYQALLYQYEVLRARLEIREHFLKTAVKEVYDNIGQVLTLIRVQLSQIRFDFEKEKKERIDSSGELVGQTIRDLRGMVQLFYPEEDIISGTGFCQAAELELHHLFPGATFSISEKTILPPAIKNENGLILFSIYLELLQMIKNECRGEITTVVIEFSKKKIHCLIQYTGAVLTRNILPPKKDQFNLSVFERAELTGGSLQIKNTTHEARNLKLVIPTNQAYG